MVVNTINLYITSGKKALYRQKNFQNLNRLVNRVREFLCKQWMCTEFVALLFAHADKPRSTNKTQWLRESMGILEAVSKHSERCWNAQWRVKQIISLIKTLKFCTIRGQRCKRWLMVTKFSYWVGYVLLFVVYRHSPCIDFHYLDWWR